MPGSKSPLRRIAIWSTSVCTSFSRVAVDNSADSFLDLIVQTCQMLATQPEMGELREEFATGRYRSFSVGNYVIYFCPTLRRNSHRPSSPRCP